MYYLSSENKGTDQLYGGTAQLICVFVFSYAKSSFYTFASHTWLQ